MRPPPLKVTLVLAAPFAVFAALVGALILMPWPFATSQELAGSWSVTTCHKDQVVVRLFEDGCCRVDGRACQWEVDGGVLEVLGASIGPGRARSRPCSNSPISDVLLMEKEEAPASTVFTVPGACEQHWMRLPGHQEQHVCEQPEATPVNSTNPTCAFRRREFQQTHFVSGPR